MQGRRQNDRLGQLVLACPRRAPTGTGIVGAVAGAGLEARTYALDASSTRLSSTSDRRLALDAPHANLLLNFVGDDLVLVIGEIVHIPRSEDAEGLERRLLGLTLEAQRSAARRRRRSAQLDTYLLLSERLVRAECRGEVWSALLEHTGQIVGGSRSVILARSPLSSETSALEWHAGAPALDRLPDLSEDMATRLATPGAPSLIERGDPDPRSVALEPMFQAVGAVRTACSDLGSHGLLFVTERRVEREFTAR